MATSRSEEVPPVNTVTRMSPMQKSVKSEQSREA
jgi:hypothetical protein